MAIKMKKTHRPQPTTNFTIVNHPRETSSSANRLSENSSFPSHLPENSGYSDHRQYECKTCRRKFDSFQALGGHQGIHRKIIQNEDVCLSSLQIVVPKLHQCKMCMKEFPTGQALGGHMRRHRVKNTATLMNKEVLWRQQAAEEVAESDLTLEAAVEVEPEPEPEPLKAEEDQQHELKSELVLAAKELRLSI